MDLAPALVLLRTISACSGALAGATRRARPAHRRRLRRGAGRAQPLCAELGARRLARRRPGAAQARARSRSTSACASSTGAASCACQAPRRRGSPGAHADIASARRTARARALPRPEPAVPSSPRTGRRRYLVRRAAVRERGERTAGRALGRRFRAARQGARGAAALVRCCATDQQLARAVRRSPARSASSSRGSWRTTGPTRRRPGVSRSLARSVMRFMAATRASRSSAARKRALDSPRSRTRRRARAAPRDRSTVPPCPCRTDPDWLGGCSRACWRTPSTPRCDRRQGRPAWSSAGDGVRITVGDDCPRRPATENIFVPFFTAKRRHRHRPRPLARDRRPSEHLDSRTIRRSGCRATITLPAAWGCRHRGVGRTTGVRRGRSLERTAAKHSALPPPPGAPRALAAA